MGCTCREEGRFGQYVVTVSEVEEQLVEEEQLLEEWRRSS